MQSNLPTTQDTKQFFDKYFDKQVSFPSSQIDATVGFFLKKDFDLESARSTAIVLLNQARIDNVPVFQLLDTLKGMTNVQLSQIVTQVLNASREKTSMLGYKIQTATNTFDTRNILV
jgi:hypothetical protein